MSSSVPSYESIGDAREGPRKIFHRRAVLSVASSPPIPARTVDISAGGCSAIIDHPLQDGQLCQLAISVVLDDVPTWLQFDCQAHYCVLVGITGFRVGLRFMQVEAATAARLKQIMGSS